MILKLIGAVCIVSVCGGCGFWMARRHLLEERMLRELIIVLDYMECELLYRLTPLPVLCRQASSECRGIISSVFLQLAIQMENQISPDLKCCMAAAISQIGDMPHTVLSVLEQLGASLGRFDLQGQLKGLNSIKSMCQRNLETLGINRDARVRGYKTLGLCAGAALVILFI